MSSSSRLGQLAMRTLPTSAPRMTPWSTVSSGGRILACSISTTRPAQNLVRRQIERANKRLGKQPSPAMKMRNEEAFASRTMTSDSMTVVFPGTFIRPPWSQWPKGMMKWLYFFGQFVITQSVEIGSAAMIKFSSKPTFFKRATFKHNKPAIMLTAKALHRQMAEALAIGDKETLRKVCVAKFATTLQASIDSRPKGRRYGWELVEYTNKLWYPSIRSYRMTPSSKLKEAPIIQQVVVAISSKQRRVEYDDSRKGQGKMVPGSEREVDVVEYVALVNIVNAKTFTSDTWKIVGVIKPTTPESWSTEKRLSQTLEKSEALGR